MDNESKDSDDISTSSDKDKGKYHYNENEMPLELNDDNFKIHPTSHKYKKSVYDLHPKQQEAMQQEMFAQMKQLKAHNEAMGYHGYSGYLQRHDSNMNLQATENDTTDFKTETEIQPSNVKYNGNMALHEVLESNDDYTDKELILKHTKTEQNKSSIILSQTQELKHKLELVTSSINKIRHDLQQQTNDNKNISSKQLNNLIMYFQNQLTEIQDQIEDAENDIESHIDVKFIKYMEEIKVNKNKIKALKKQKKDKEKQEQINKHKEQQRVIELQRLQIDQLISAQSHHSSQHNSPRYDMPKHQINQSTYFPLDNAPNNQLNTTPNKNRNRKSSRTYSIKSRARKHSIQSAGTLGIPRIQDDDVTNIYPQINNQINNPMNSGGHGVMIESDDDDDDDEMNIQYINGQINAVPGVVNGVVNFTNNTNRRLIHTNTIGITHSGSYNQSPNYIEGAYQSMGMLTQRTEQPLLSDNAVKIIGGVVIVLAGLYVISKYFSNRRDRNSMAPPNMRRQRMKY